MKTNQKYMALSLVATLIATGMSLGALSFAQTSPTLGCSVNVASVGINQAAILTATGGSGTYYWSGPNLNITNAAGSQFAVSFPEAGTYPIQVQSAGQSAICNVSVNGTVSTNAISCFPATQNVVLGQSATVTASGGDGTYVWSSPDLSIANPNGTGFSASYASIGLKTLTVTSAGLVTTCAVNVLSNGTGTVLPAPPALPNTGGGYGK